MEICTDVIQLLATRSLENFAHAMTAQLSWHAQNFAATTFLESGPEQIEISIELELWWEYL